MSRMKSLTVFKHVTNITSALLITISSMGSALLIPQVASASPSTIYVNNLQPDWTSVGGGGVWSAYYGPLIGDQAVSPGTTAIYNGREAGIIKAGIAYDPGDNIYWDQGIFAFKVQNVDISTFAGQTLTYDVQNQTGTNPVWVRIRLVGGTQYQFVPTTNPTSWHTVNAATGLWQLMDVNGNATGPSITLSQVATDNAGALVDRVYLTLGTGNSYNVSDGVGTVGWVDKATIGEVTYDFVKLPAPTVLGFTNPSLACDAFSNNGTTTTAWDAVEGASSYNYRSWTTAAGSIYNNEAAAYPVNGINATSLNGSFNQGEGKYSFEVQSVGTNGNTSDWSSACGVTYDNTAPAAPTITYPGDNSFIANIQHVTWNAVTDDFANPVTYIFQSSTSAGTNTDGSFTSPAYTSLALSDTQIPTPGTPENTYYLHVKAVDAAGNIGAWSTAIKVTVDNTLPTVSITSPSNGQVLSVNATSHMLGISGTATDANFNYYYCYVTDAHGEVGIRDPKCETAWNFGSPFHSAFAQTATGTSNGPLGKVDMTGLANGAYTAHLVAHDLAGNVSETSMPFVLDNTAPVVTGNFNTPAGSVLGISTTNTPVAALASVTVPAVLGDSIIALASEPAVTTETPATPAVTEANNGNGQVQGDDTANVKTAASTFNFLGLGWWWLPVLLIMLGLLSFVGASLRHKRSRY